MNIPYLECFFERCLLWGPFWQKKTLLSVFLEKNNFFEPTLEPNSFSEYFFSALFWELFSLTAFWIAFLSTFLNMFVHSRIIFLGNAFLSKNTILSTSLSNITFLSVFLSTFLRAFSVERFLSALLSTFLSAFFVEHFFECFFEHYKHNSRYFRTLLLILVNHCISIWNLRFLQFSNAHLYPAPQQGISNSIRNSFLGYPLLCNQPKYTRFKHHYMLCNPLLSMKMLFLHLFRKHQRAFLCIVL